MNRKLADFAHITSHNLRAPLSNLNSLLYFYRDTDDLTDKNDMMDKFETVINNLDLTMSVLVGALRANSEPNEARGTMSFQEILERTEESISSQIVKRDAKITTDFVDVPTITYNRLYSVGGENILRWLPGTLLVFIPRKAISFHPR